MGAEAVGGGGGVARTNSGAVFVSGSALRGRGVGGVGVTGAGCVLGEGLAAGFREGASFFAAGEGVGGGGEASCGRGEMGEPSPMDRRVSMTSVRLACWSD